MSGGFGVSQALLNWYKVDLNGAIMRKKLFHWARTPIFVPRWMLSAKYGAFIVLGIFTLLWGNATISLATFDGYTTFWAIGVIAMATLCLPGSFRERFEGYEKWTALILAGLTTTWSVAAIIRAANDETFQRIPGAWAILMLSFLPAARAFGLLRGK